MPTEHASQLFVLVAVGFGLIVAGAANVFLVRFPRWTQFGIGLLSATLAFGAADLLGSPSHQSLSAAGITASIVALSLVASSQRLRASLASAVAFVCRPRVRWGAVVATGFALIFGALAAYDAADNAVIERQMLDLDAAAEIQPLRVAKRAKAITDRGTAIELREVDETQTLPNMESVEERFFTRNPMRHQVIRQQAASTASNCHGWVFTGGHYWVGGSHVDAILNDNDYVPVSDPQPDDLVVYRSNANVLHTAVVQYVAKNKSVMVEGKWGSQGVYLHAVEHSAYGTEYTFYRSSRRGHLLAGVGVPGSANPYDDPLATD